MPIRPRFGIRCLMLAVALAGLLAGGAEWVRRNRRAALLPPPPPWGPAAHPVRRQPGPDLWVNWDDVRAGIDPPRAKWVYFFADGSCQTADAPPGAVRPGQISGSPIGPYNRGPFIYSPPAAPVPSVRPTH